MSDLCHKTLLSARMRRALHLDKGPRLLLEVDHKQRVSPAIDQAAGLYLDLGCSGGDRDTRERPCKGLFLDMGVAQNPQPQLIALHVKHSPAIRIMVPAGIGVGKGDVKSPLGTRLHRSDSFDFWLIRQYRQRDEGEQEWEERSLHDRSLDIFQFWYSHEGVSAS